MSYMTVEHKPPPRQVERNGLLVPTAPLIRRATDGDPAEREDARAKLAAIGVYWHVPDEGSPPPLGYTDYQLVGIEYRREPAGTPEERQAALAAQEAVERDAYLDALECTRLQGKLALIQAGLWDQYEAIIAAMLPSMSPAQRVFVDDALVWKYRDQVLQAFVAALGMTAEQVVALFEHARTL